MSAQQQQHGSDYVAPLPYDSSHCNSDTKPLYHCSVPSPNHCSSGVTVCNRHFPVYYNQVSQLPRGSKVPHPPKRKSGNILRANPLKQPPGLSQLTHHTRYLVGAKTGTKQSCEKYHSMTMLFTWSRCLLKACPGLGRYCGR